MSRRKHRPERCPQCWDMGNQAPVATHRVKAQALQFFGPPTPYVVNLCAHHARDTRRWAGEFGRAYRMRIYRFRGNR